jgi:hypothetical protein
MKRTPRDVAQLGSAPALGAGCRQFESGHPDFVSFIALFMANQNNLGSSFTLCKVNLFYEVSAH